MTRSPELVSYRILFGFPIRGCQIARICFWREGFEAAFGPQRRGEVIPIIPEFKGNVLTDETRGFWRPSEEFGGRGMTIHWNANDEAYWLMGDSSVLNMIKLLRKQHMHPGMFAFPLFEK